MMLASLLGYTQSWTAALVDQFQKQREFDCHSIVEDPVHYCNVEDNLQVI